MAMRYLACKLRAPAAALRRPRSLSANASQICSVFMPTFRFQKTPNFELPIRRDIEEAVRYNRFHRRCIMASIVVGVGLGGLSCVWYARSYRKALMEHVTGFEVISPYAPSTPE
uniref:Uncharacterized protein n=1 Tax=Oryza glaberrima TaxID=4538 RepID=I1Q843_ORYGL